jgi:hypothetical protein
VTEASGYCKVLSYRHSKLVLTAKMDTLVKSWSDVADLSVSSLGSFITADPLRVPGGWIVQVV